MTDPPPSSSTSVGSPLGGPIQIFLLGFEDFRAAVGVADELAALSDAGTIAVVESRLLVKETPDAVVALRPGDLDHGERAELRAAAGALVGLGAGDVHGGVGAAAGNALGADAALAVGEIGLCEAEIGALGEELEVGDALLLVVIENVWAAGLAGALREAGAVFAQQDYLSPEGLVALGSMLDIDVTLDV